MDIKLKAKQFFKSYVKTRLLKLILWMCMIIAVYATLSTAVKYGLGRYSCWSAWHESGMDHKYSLRSGCKIQRGDNWMPAKNFRLD